MRLNIRLLRYLAIVGVACLILSFLALSTDSTAALHRHVSSLKNGWVSASQPTKDDESSDVAAAAAAAAAAATTAAAATATATIATTTVKPESIRALWKLWSQAFEEARPECGKIQLRSSAGNVPVPGDGSSVRSPDINRVINEESDIKALGTAHASFLKSLKSYGDAETGHDIFNGTGIVVVGGGEYFGPAIIGLQMLRKTGSTLPVEVFVANPAEYEKQVCDEYLPKLGAKCLVITDFLKSGNGIREITKRSPTSLKGGMWEKRDEREEFEVTHYQLKSLAMLFCSFAEVLYLDSDSIPLVNPATELFARAPYNTTGLVIWPDFWIASETPLFWTAIAGLSEFPANLPKSSSEAGQLLINKKTHIKTLLLANYYNVYGPKYYYPLLSQGALGQGDKETFLAAAVVLGEPWYRVQTPVQSVSRWASARVKGSGMVQSHPFDDMVRAQIVEAGISASSTSNTTVTDSGEVRVRPAFLHANTPKMNAGHLVDEGDLVDPSNGNSRLRLWGSKDETTKTFGTDLEHTVWELLVVTGCNLQHVLNDWKKRTGMCDKLEEHYQSIFGGTSIVEGGNVLRWRNKLGAGSAE